VLRVIRTNVQAALLAPPARSSEQTSQRGTDYGWVLVGTLGVTETISWGVLH
jgi:hypothetical protein